MFRFWKYWQRKKSFASKQKADYDFLPLFFWDKSLNQTAKIIMSLVAGGEHNRDRTLTRLKEYFPKEVVADLSTAIQQLERYGYLSQDEYTGAYAEKRVDRRLCICPTARLPKITHPTGQPLAPCYVSSSMFSLASDMGYIAETGEATTYLLYDAIRIFSAVECLLTPQESVLLPAIGLETKRDNTAPSLLSAYPHAIISVVITSHRIILVQEDGCLEGRQAGLARIFTKDYSEFESIRLDELHSRIVFEAKREDAYGRAFYVDLLTEFAFDHFIEYYDQAKDYLSPSVYLPPITFGGEVYFG